MRALNIWMVVLACMSGCAVRLVGNADPTFIAHIDPSIANDRDRAPLALRWHGDVFDIVLSLLDVEGYAAYLERLRIAAEPIPHPMRVTETVPADVLDRLDAIRISQR